MPVLKQHSNTPAMREAIVLDLGDIGAQAARIRAAAETQAAQIISDARAKSESVANRLHDEAEKQGYAAGLEKGIAEGREQGRVEALAQATEQLQQLTAAWSQVATDWEQQRTDMEREARQAVLSFALSAAEKIVHRVIEVDESVVVDQAAQALSMVLSAHDANVSIHPVDRPMLEDALPDLLKELATLQHIELVDDESITPGGCIVTFGQGRIDATIERQLQRLIDLILPEPPQPPDVDADAARQTDPPGADAAAPSLAESIAPQIDTQRIADAASEVAQPIVDSVPSPPVYEITDRGLIETRGEADGQAQDAGEPGATKPDPAAPPTEPETEV